MKRILISLLTVGVVGATAFGASRAFFSDTETSTRNTFQAGGLDLKIDSTAHYAGLVCNVDHKWALENGTTTRPDLVDGPCDGTWVATDLTTEKFFSLSDIKPGDEGENTISLTVDNDAWACVRIFNMHNVKNMAENLYFTAWADLNGNNIWDANEPQLFSNVFGPASDILNEKVYALADSTHGLALPIGTKYIGLRWCAGEMTVNLSGTPIITCNGATMGNDAQGGSLTADIQFYVEQARNNPNFRCGAPTQVLDYLNIGDLDSESDHNLLGWSNNQLGLPYNGINYGGGSSDKSFRLLMGPGDPLVCATGTEPATFTMNAGGGTATKLTLEHLDGQVNDSFDIYINSVKVDHYTAGSLGTETWVVTPFTFSGVSGTVNVELVTTNPATIWCEEWGQVAFSNAKLE